jgi:ABC-type amino acid transport substrate-binding protein
MKGKVMKSLLLVLMLLFFAAPAWADGNKIYDRIMESGTIRCGYYTWPPFFSKDPNTGKHAGIGYDLTEEIGRQLNLKIEWVEEVPLDAMFEGYTTGRYDMICLPVVATPSRTRASDFTIPFVYLSYNLYARGGDKRFDNHFEKINAADVKYASLDGDMNALLGKELFPLAQKVDLPPMAPPSDLLLQVATGKADVTAMEPVMAMEFMRHNTGKIRLVGGGPVRVMPGTFSVPLGEEKLKAMLNTTFRTLIDIGYINRILKTSPDYDATVLRVAPAYQLPTHERK